MKLLTVSIVLFWFKIHFSQNYIGFRNTLNEGNFWFYEQQFDSAMFYYTKAESYNLDFFAEEAHLFSRTLWELGYRKKSMKILLRFGFSDFFVNDTTYYQGLSFDDRNKVVKKLKSIEEKLLYKNMPFFDQLREKDQMYRRVVLQYTSGSQQRDSLNRLMIYQDSLNFLELINEIKLNGYPGGYVMAPVGPGVILLHAKRDWLLNYTSLFQCEIEKGRMSLHDYSKAFDRCFMKSGDDSIRVYNAYLPITDSSIISPYVIYYNRCLIGMSPYYDIYIPRSYKRGAKPPKSAFYEYYKEKKEKFNCIRVK